MRLGSALMVAGVLTPLLVIGVTGATAPPLDTGGLGERVVVGVQGPHDRGQVLEIGPDGDVLWRHTAAASYHDVTPLDEGRVLATYATGGQQDCGPYEPPCARTGVRIIDPDPEPHVAWEWSVPVRTLGNSEIHDAEALPNGNLLVADMDRERIMVVDRDTGTVVWQWNASQRYDPPTDPTREDWLHINDVDRIGAGRYLVSVRNANQLVVVNRTCTCVTEVVNADRGAADGLLRGDPTVLRGQHNPQWLGEGRVLVADSSNDRLVELAKNDTTGRWEVVWTDGSAGGIAFAWPRDADRQPNGHTLVTDSRNNRVLELDEDGRQVAAVEVPSLPYDAEYRSRDEPVGGPAASSPADATPGDGEGHVRGLTQLKVALHHGVGLPYWLSEYHLGTTLVGLVVVIVGGLLRLARQLRQPGRGQGAAAD